MRRRLFPSKGLSSWAIIPSVFSRYVLVVGGLAVVLACCSQSTLAVADQTCESETLRATFGSLFLPDCRTYERVSPSYTEGYPIFVANRSTDGEKAILTSLGSLDSVGAGESVARGTVYLDTRTSSGWQLSSLDAPLSEFVGQVPLALEPASGETLWEQHTPAESIDRRGMYVRTAGVNPVYRFVGPLNIPFEGESQEASTSIYLGRYHTMHPLAATSDYEHIVMEGGASEDRWPFDMTPASARSSLYEYSGTGNSQPILVGVKGSEKGNADLVGHCGTELGSERVGSTYNALSEKGTSVFFTVLPESICGESAPQTVEIYARKNGALVDPGPAVTTDVSESICTSVCGGESGKNFEGASADGGQVFFTSTQKLINDAVDGTAGGGAAEEGPGCAHIQGPGGCNLYEYRFDVASGPHLHLIAGGEVLGVAGIAEDGSHIYFVSRSMIGSAGTNQFNEEPLGGQPNLYVYDTITGETAFITTLGEGDTSDWSKVFSSRSTEVGGEGGEDLLFESSKKSITPDDTTAKITQLFEYDADTRELVRLTKGEYGYNEDGNGVQEGVQRELFGTSASQLGGGTDFKSASNRLNMSADGRTVAFETSGRLSARATSAEAEGPFGPHCFSVYEFHSSGALNAGTVHLISDGRDTQIYKGFTCGTEFQAISPSGADIMFETDDPLLPTDVDGVGRDIYDARVDGGFPMAEGAQPSACGASCEGTSSVVPIFSSPTSMSDSGETQVNGSVSRNRQRPAKRRSSKKKGHVKKRRGAGKNGSRRLRKASVQAAKGRK